MPLGWAARNERSLRGRLYHLFLVDERSACRRVALEDAITPVYEAVPPGAAGCHDCLEHRGREAHTAPGMAATAPPLFASRPTRGIRVRSL